MCGRLFFVMEQLVNSIGTLSIKKEKSIKFRQIFTLYLLIYIALCGIGVAQTVDIPDPNLRDAVRDALNLPGNAPITQADMRRLTKLEPRFREIGGITDLSGLEFATNLEHLDLAMYPISDLTPLATLVQLRTLWISQCNITDIIPLANLTGLKSLDASHNRIVEINPLVNLTSLVELLLNHNRIVDVNPLAHLTNLEVLWIQDNNIMDISPFADLTRLTELKISANEIADVTPLENLTNLEHLNTENNPIFDPNSPHVDIPDPNLRAAISDTLNLSSDVPITQAAMRRLTKLAGHERGIADLSGLEFATNLEILELALNPISNVAPLANLVQLHTVSLWRCELSDISPLVDLTRLKYLYLFYNRIVDISSLANLTQLVELDLSHNRIVDVNPLANLTNLERLNIAGNLIADHSFLDTLSLSEFRYDEACEMPPEPIRDRIRNRTYPSVFTFWGHILNRPHLSEIEKRASYDLRCCHDFGLYISDTPDNPKMFTESGLLEKAIQERDDLLAHNPNRIILLQLEFREALLSQYPEDWPYWLRNAQGKIAPGWGSEQFPPIPDGKINFTHPGFQDRVVAQAIAVSKCGIFDGIFFDHWGEVPLLSPYVDNETEHLARHNIIERIRAQTRPDFLIMGNTNDHIIPRTGPRINGGFMETLVPGTLADIPIESHLYEIEHALNWLENNLREPVINALEGQVIPTEPPDSPNNLRWMRALTTLSLTFSNGYVVFSEPELHTHYWYDFWDADLGQPVGPKTQLYDEDIPGLYIREFTNGWAVYNHSGQSQEITLLEFVTGVASGVEGATHTLADLDGEMYLREAVASDELPVTSKSPADVNGDGVVNILDLTLVARGFWTDSLEGDVNGDGVVNVFDLVIVANQF